MGYFCSVFLFVRSRNFSSLPLFLFLQDLFLQRDFLQPLLSSLILKQPTAASFSVTNAASGPALHSRRFLVTSVQLLTNSCQIKHIQHGGLQRAPDPRASRGVSSAGPAPEAAPRRKAWKNFQAFRTLISFIFRLLFYKRANVEAALL